ncbi:Uncharacterised protein (plasmid) [Tsukamurella tyrosinosolvens]|uniref:Uncharacterized protein n=2 Tax=Tsukamurella tyrosinosolvens TaxID=57704 RepID=A0A1H4UZW9_TSUTY|nr:hypothetical protein [Tsukamurella tyrosinosolvens]SEC74297.1 hypothetical protein SAMN04489793_3095 [Tsukamurella tyrosinosolvens]VEH90771.1 Uncharacterised protein [Tsukamurella tyrosinosolvens]
MAASSELPLPVRAMLSDLAVAVESASASRDDEDRIALRRVRRALAAHPRCDTHHDDDPVSCGWKHVVRSVQAAIDDHSPAIGVDADNARLYRALAEVREKHAQTAEMLEIALQDAAAVLGMDDSLLLDADVMKKLSAAAERAGTELSPAGLDALPKDTVVLTRDPRLVPAVTLWIRADDDQDGAWWRIGTDDTFQSDDVLYGDPREARVLYVPDEVLLCEGDRDA